MLEQEQRRQEIFKKLIAFCSEKLPKATLPLFIEFMQQYYSTVEVHELEKREIVDIFGAAYCHWELVCSRKPGETKIHIYNPHFEYHGWSSKYTIVQVAHDDMPFLVDSIRIAIRRMGFDTHLMVNFGGMRLRRDASGKVLEVLPIDAPIAENIYPEAPIHIEIDKQTDQAILDELKERIEKALQDVRATVTDWPQMRDKMRTIINDINTMKLNLDKEEIEETKSFLEWLVDNHFTFLGYRYYAVVGEGENKGLEAVPETGLGVLRGNASKGVKTFSSMYPEAYKFATSYHLLIISKAKTRATVHRDINTDYIGIKVFNHEGELVGEHRFIGLYTSAAYTDNPKFIPFVRHKVETVMRNAKLSPSGFAAKALRNILDTLPRDDLFQATAADLTELALGILSLQDRKRIRLFTRIDAYQRFASSFVYVPTERFDTDLAYAMQAILVKEFGALECSFTTWFSDSPLARVHYVMRLEPHQPRVFDIEAIEAKLVEVAKTWKDSLKNELIERLGEEQGAILSQQYRDAFPAGYRESFDARHAVYDIQNLESLSNEKPLIISYYKPIEATSKNLHYKLLGMNEQISLSDVLPIFENMGLKVAGERPYEIKRKDGTSLWICDFALEPPAEFAGELENMHEIFQEAFLQVWGGQAENDSFNKLVITAGLTWQEVVILRAYTKYLVQTEFPYSQAYVEACLNKYPTTAHIIVEYFKMRFNPHKKATPAELTTLEVQFKHAIEQVTTLDEDKILGTLFGLLNATLRTNYFQLQENNQPKSYLSFKLNPKLIPVLPLPLPMFEIFVYSPQFEGIHLRNFYVARGGLRWSDRPEDFRTEILGLMKAQNVKNSIIVPSGSKGGFVPKRLPKNGTRDEILTEAISCYQNFIRGLLDLTDNLKEGLVVPPLDVVRYDSDDTYLVVAADKGTATFSDIANAIAAEYGFWLGDAFASGGSSGYDHKKMGITARGAWESVKRHFRMLGVNIQSQDFTVLGIGDLSGDVFGNGMLLSEHIKLVGAFDHRHIFIDPNPNPQISFQERKRIFELPRSSWMDYNSELISAGGGVFPRTAKSIPVSPEMKAIFDLNVDTIEPNALVKAMLCSRVDLLWNGGIGTFVKASYQTHASVGDRTNDAIRVNGNELRCKVVGEGGNLGFTQLSRIEYDLCGGHIYTDFIDNSAGVDCSDHEVNVKILLNQVVVAGDMTLKQRDKLLAEMTDEVARLVLNDNYRQTLALRVAKYLAAQNIDIHGNYIRYLADNGLINRDIEFLPSDTILLERKAAGKSLALPELAILFSYCKSIIKQEILQSELPEDPALSSVVVYAFPRAIREKYREQMDQHPLRREIIATVISNALVNEVGFTFVYELNSETGCSVSDVMRAYAVTRTLFKLPKITDDVLSLDNTIDPYLQLDLLVTLSRIARHSTRWLLVNHRMEISLERYKDYFESNIAELIEKVEEFLSGQALEEFQLAYAKLIDAQVPSNIARYIASENALISSLDLIEAAKHQACSVLDMAKVYFNLAEVLDLGWLHKQIRAYPSDSQWDACAREALADTLALQHRNLAIAIFKGGVAFDSLSEKLEAWKVCHQSHLDRWHMTVANLKSSTNPTISMIIVAIRILADMALLSKQLICEVPLNTINSEKLMIKQDRESALSESAK